MDNVDLPPCTVFIASQMDSSKCARCGNTKEAH